MEKVKGFTLIELMIVVAIIGILAAIGIPAYQDYITKAQVSEAVTLGAGLKSALGDYGWTYATWPTALVQSGAISNTEIKATLVGKYATVSPTITGSYPSGTVTITMTTGNASGQTILFTTADKGTSWSCTLGTLNVKYRPNACR